LGCAMNKVLQMDVCRRPATMSWVFPVPHIGPARMGLSAKMISGAPSTYPFRDTGQLADPG
jgi:hypothetical protein